MNIEERLREKSKVVLPFEQSCNTLNYTPIRFIDLDDALEITKDLFTKEQVEELRKESYTKGVEDAIKICNSEMNKWERNDYSIGRYESSVEIRFQLQKLIEQELGQLKEK